MSKVCLLIPDGVGIRNYLYSDLLKLLHEDGQEVLIWHGLAQEVVSMAAKINEFLPQQRELKSFPEDIPVQILRESSTYGRLRHNVRITNNPTLMLNWHQKKGPFKRRILVGISEFLGRQISNYDEIQATEKLYFSRLRKTQAYKYYFTELKEMNPDFLFCTHQRFPGAAFAMAAAQDLGIKTMTSIFSWDNLPKARLPLRSDFYAVWSSFMKKEIRFYYPEIAENQIIITGTPQFDFYRNQENIQTREEFSQRFGLDSSKNWVCFSGCDIATSPHDAKYLRDVADALKSEKDIQLIFRQVPVETVERYSEVLKDFPEIVHLNPFWHKGKFWQDFYPLPEDVAHLVNLSFHCATVINIGSTMALDFSWFDSPGLYLNYDHQQGQIWTTKDIYRFQHFRSMDDLDAVCWANSQEEILPVVKQIISSPDIVAKDRKKWLSLIVGESDGLSSASKIAEFINSFSKTPASVD